MTLQSNPSHIIETGLKQSQGQFAKDVLRGLSAKKKKLSSQYFYDETGSRIFEEIMKLPEYYLTNCEWDIFRKYKQEILYKMEGESFQLVDLGAGDAQKTRILLDHFYSQGSVFQYVPIDINRHVLEELQASLLKDLPGLETIAVVAEYFDALEWIKINRKGRKLVLFMGSNIGNFNKKAAASFLTEMLHVLEHDDLLLIGIDLKKDPRKILRAYDDSSGVTARFNFNLLHRINTELGADFDLNKWTHYASYNPVNGATTSYLVSKENQKIFIKALDKTFLFDAFEPVLTEYSYKYSLMEITAMAGNCGFEIVQNFLSEDEGFADVLWRVVKN
jgi:dimethylhistidine N-methyltransferase